MEPTLLQCTSTVIVSHFGCRGEGGRIPFQNIQHLPYFSRPNSLIKVLLKYATTKDSPPDSSAQFRVLIHSFTSVQYQCTVHSHRPCLHYAK